MGGKALSLGLIVAMGAVRGGTVVGGGGSLFCALCIQMHSDMYMCRYYVAFVSVQSGASFASGKKTNKTAKTARYSLL